MQYGYDRLNQPTQKASQAKAKTTAPSYSNTFAYDLSGNATSSSLLSSDEGTIDDQYATGDFSLNGLYDGSGNPTTYKSATFAFDPEERLTSISSPAFSAAYDGDGLRIKKTTASGTTYYLYDGGSPVVEETYSGSAASFKSLNGWTADGWRTRYDESSGQAYCFAYDPQGNLVQRQNPNAYAGGAYDEAIYEGYGALRQDVKLSAGATGGTTVGARDPVGFGGQFGYYTDTETGLLCLTHRYYDPGTGKFLNRDPIGYGGGINLYGFTGNNPVNESDPSGFDPLFGGAIPFPGFNPAAVPGAGSAVRVLPRVTSRLGVQGTIIVAGAVAGVELYQYVRSGGRESSGFTALGDKIGTYVGDRLYPNPAQSPIIYAKKDDVYTADRRPGGLSIGRKITDKDALSRLKQGEDIYSSRSKAKQLQKKASGGTVEDAAHNPGYYPHFNGSRNGVRIPTSGHGFFGNPAP